MEIDEIDGGLEALAPAKLNLYLDVTGRRPDGFHEIDSIFQTVSLRDRLRFEATDDGTLELEERGVRAGGENLVLRAARALRESPFAPAGTPLGARIRLEKRIASGAGLGGGSSDAAATLVALARLWKLEIGLSDLEGLAAGLGSDVPFFLHGGTARCRGRGEIVLPYREPFDRAPPFHYVLVSPGLFTSTKDVYDALDREGKKFALTPPLSLDTMTPSELMNRLRRGDGFFNRLEGVTTALVPELTGVSSRMREEPFLVVRMTGSGSTFFGLCRDGGQAAELARRLAAAFPSSTQVVAVKSLPGHRTFERPTGG